MKARYTVTYEIEISDHDEKYIKMIFYEQDDQAMFENFGIGDESPSDRKLELVKKSGKYYEL